MEDSERLHHGLSVFMVTKFIDVSRSTETVKMTDRMYGVCKNFVVRTVERRYRIWTTKSTSSPRTGPLKVLSH